MATLLLSAAGAAIGGSFGGTVAGLSSLALGKAAGATLGSVIDQRLLGLGSEPVETGRVERFRVMGSGEGADLPRVFGRMRVAGQLIWSSRFLETVNKTNVGGKGAGGSASVRQYSYSISVAVALCEGEIARVGRIWADGQVLAQSTVTWRLHVGSEDQLPDPVIAAIEGEDTAPAYRGTAYVVFENLELGPYGNRIPQFNFEVFRRPAPSQSAATHAVADDVRGVALVPGTGEYALATTPVFYRRGKGRYAVPNVNNDQGRPDLVVSLEQMQAELPNAKAVSLVVSWFGSDLRCDRCRLEPAVEQREEDAPAMPWQVNGVERSVAKAVSRVDDRPLFGGTPADASVLEAIAYLKATGQNVMFYPFILMDIPAENALEDPWTGAMRQPAVPWRGRITLSLAPGRAGSPDRSAAAASEVEAFFGNARASDFRIIDGTVVYFGPAEWSYRRFILHYAHLCALSGGVEAFCIGSEMRSLTQIRDSASGYPAVRALRQLAAEVRSVLGPEVRISYAADWSEYFGHHPADGSGDVLFHLDPLWADPAIDFIGIDNYMPLSDWRDGSGHADAEFGSIYDLDYLRGNVAGGEGYDWYYADAAGRQAQDRRPITDGSHGEPWVFRYKDLASWWSLPHHDRVGGVRASTPTGWVPRSKPFWFTELGCPAVDKGTNQPNVFYDPKSSESMLPHHSNGLRDDFIQQRYLRAMFDHWADPANNPGVDALRWAHGRHGAFVCLGLGRAAVARFSDTSRDVDRRRELRPRALAECAARAAEPRRDRGRDLRALRCERPRPRRSLRNRQGLHDRRGRECASEPAAADADLRLRQFQPGRAAWLRQPVRPGHGIGGRRHARACIAAAGAVGGSQRQRSRSRQGGARFCARRSGLSNGNGRGDRIRSHGAGCLADERAGRPVRG
jgi:hypothetical protein